MKRFICIILSVLLLTSVFSIFATSTVSAKSLKKYQYEDFEYVINENKISLCEYIGAEKYADNLDLTFKNSDGTPYVKANSTYQKSVGKKFNFKKYIQDADTIKYKSNNQAIATVTTDGIVTFKTTGKVKIKVKATNNCGTTIKKVKFNVE